MVSSKSKLYFLKARPKLFSISALYHENTKLRSFHRTVESGILEVSREKMKKLSQAFKVYPNCKLKVELPTDCGDSEACIEDVIRHRRSTRDFSGDALTIEELAKLLYFSYGITGSMKADGVVQPLRAAPSGGALYPLELYPVAFGVKGLDPGVYHYNVKSHLLELLGSGDHKESLYKYVFEQDMMLQASVVILITAMFERNQWKYRERGYRYILLDAGHLAENLYLMATAMNLGCCTIGGFLDDNINGMLDIDGVHESTIYVVVVGRPSGP